MSTMTGDSADAHETLNYEVARDPYGAGVAALGYGQVYQEVDAAALLTARANGIDVSSPEPSVTSSSGGGFGGYSVLPTGAPSSQASQYGLLSAPVGSTTDLAAPNQVAPSPSTFSTTFVAASPAPSNDGGSTVPTVPTTDPTPPSTDSTPRTPDPTPPTTDPVPPTTDPVPPATDPTPPTGPGPTGPDPTPPTPPAPPAPPSNHAPTITFSAAVASVDDAAAPGVLLGTFATSDPDGDPVSVTVTGADASKVSIVGNQVFSTGGLNAGLDASLDFTINASDGKGGTGSTGGISIAVTHTAPPPPSNHAPHGGDSSITAPEDTARALTAADFGFADTDAGDTLAAVKITGLPAAGNLTLSGSAVSVGDVVSRADIDAGHLVFAPVADANGSGYASISFQVEDSAGAYATTANSLTINITPVNDAPTSTASAVAATSGAAYTFSAADFGTFSDVDGDTLQAVRIDTLPGAGLTLSGAPVTAGQIVSIVDITAGHLQYTGVGAGSVALQASVSDGTAFSAAPSTVTITVSAPAVSLALTGVGATTLAALGGDVVNLGYGTPTVSYTGAAGSLTVTATLSDASLGSLGGAGWTGTATSVSFSGATAADIQTALAALRLTATGTGSFGADTAGSVSLMITDGTVSSPAVAVPVDVFQGVGTAGADTLSLPAGFGVGLVSTGNLAFGLGTDTLNVVGNTDLSSRAITGLEALNGSSGADTIRLKSVAADSAITTVDLGAGNDDLTVTAGAVSKTLAVIGGAGNDALHLDTSNAITATVTGVEAITAAGTANQSVTLQGAIAAAVDLGAGTGDSVTLATGASGTITSLAGVETANGSTGADNLTVGPIALGSGGAVPGATAVSLGGGNDTLHLTGPVTGTGNLKVTGGTGKDTLIVDAAAAGANVVFNDFVYSASPSQDTLDLSGILGGSVTPDASHLRLSASSLGGGYSVVEYNLGGGWQAAATISLLGAVTAQDLVAAGVIRTGYVASTLDLSSLASNGTAVLDANYATAYNGYAAVSVGKGATLTYDGLNQITLTASITAGTGTLSGSGWSSIGGGAYRWTGAASSAATALDALAFAPAHGAAAPGTTLDATVSVVATDGTLTDTETTTIHGIVSAGTPGNDTYNLDRAINTGSPYVATSGSIYSGDGLDTLNVVAGTNRVGNVDGVEVINASGTLRIDKWTPGMSPSDPDLTVNLGTGDDRFETGIANANHALVVNGGTGDDTVVRLDDGGGSYFNLVTHDVEHLTLTGTIGTTTILQVSSNPADVPVIDIQGGRLSVVVTGGGAITLDVHQIASDGRFMAVQSADNTARTLTLSQALLARGSGSDTDIDLGAAATTLNLAAGANTIGRLAQSGGDITVNGSGSDDALVIGSVGATAAHVGLGAGNDRLEIAAASGTVDVAGGGGADTVVVHAGAVVHVTDFSAAQGDKLDLTALTGGSSAGLSLGAVSGGEQAILNGGTAVAYIADTGGATIASLVAANALVV